MSFQTIDLKSWAEFAARIEWLESQREAETGQKRDDEPIFRGLGNGAWCLETTLERSFPIDRCDETLSLLAYYRKAMASKPAIESLTQRNWPGLPEFPAFARLLRENHQEWLDWFLDQHIAIYSYFIYLRHHGFPSPLLDWTASPYVAALFAFDHSESGAAHVCVYAFLKGSFPIHSGEQHFFTIGPYVQTDQRHFLQQSRYSMCVAVDGDDYKFLPHKSAMSAAGDLFQFRIPVSERETALKCLDRMNINPYSVYASEDALVRTIARRECLFRKWHL